MVNIQEFGLKIIAENISKKSCIRFHHVWFTFYEDLTDRGHYVLPYVYLGTKMENKYIIKRYSGSGYEKSNYTTLGVLDLNKCEVISIKEKSVEFDKFTILFDDNPYTNGFDFKYE